MRSGELALIGRPRLLFVAPWFLFPAAAGGRIRTTEVLRALKGGAFELTLASPASVDSKDWSAELASVCDRFVSWKDDTDRSTLRRGIALASHLPASVALDRSRNASELIGRELASNPDLLVVDFVHTAILLPDRPRARRRVVFTHNVENEIFRRNAAISRNPLERAIWRSQSSKMMRFERDILRDCDVTIAVSERDREYFRTVLGIDDVQAIPTGIDLDFNAFAAHSGGGDLVKEGGRLVFTGSLDWRPNIDGLCWFMDEVWPRVFEVSPKTELSVVGHDPDSSLVAEAAKRQLPWTFTGFVDDVRPYVWDADVYVIPLRVGGGTRLKACEAMALGCPVVSTSLGMEGLPATPDENFLRADSGAEFAAAILRLLADGCLRERLAVSARSHAEARFSSRAVGQAFEAICLGVASRPS